jgi:hypothetical protein
MKPDWCFARCDGGYTSAMLRPVARSVRGREGIPRRLFSLDSRFRGNGGDRADGQTTEAVRLWFPTVLPGRPKPAGQMEKMASRTGFEPVLPT